MSPTMASASQVFADLCPQSDPEALEPVTDLLVKRQLDLAGEASLTACRAWSVYLEVLEASTDVDRIAEAFAAHNRLAREARLVWSTYHAARADAAAQRVA